MYQSSTRRLFVTPAIRWEFVVEPFQLIEVTLPGLCKDTPIIR